jgi:hypothetical protein
MSDVCRRICAKQAAWRKITAHAAGRQASPLRRLAGHDLPRICQVPQHHTVLHKRPRDRHATAAATRRQPAGAVRYLPQGIGYPQVDSLNPATAVSSTAAKPRKCVMQSSRLTCRRQHRGRATGGTAAGRRLQHRSVHLRGISPVAAGAAGGARRAVRPLPDPPSRRPACWSSAAPRAQHHPYPVRHVE